MFCEYPDVVKRYESEKRDDLSTGRFTSSVVLEMFVNFLRPRDPMVYLQMDGLGTLLDTLFVLYVKQCNKST